MMMAGPPKHVGGMLIQIYTYKQCVHLLVRLLQYRNMHGVQYTKFDFDDNEPCDPGYVLALLKRIRVTNAVKF
jgi:hypothetical protein